MFDIQIINLITLKSYTMKLFQSKAILATSICVASMLGSCQQEGDNVVLPQSEAATSDQNARTNLASGTLIKDGNTDLSYNNQHPSYPWKETSSTGYTEFTYTSQLITAKRYVNGTPTTYQYTLDASGRCIQSFHSATNKTYIYEYSFNGQLTKWYNKDQPSERGILTYFANSANDWNKSLGMVSFYDSQGAKYKELTFGYGGAMGVPDKQHLNLDVLPAGVSKYLPIFGTFNINLVQNIIEDIYLANGQKQSSIKYLYSYTLNYAGKVSNVSVKKLNGTLVSSTDRTYSKPTYIKM